MVIGSFPWPFRTFGMLWSSILALLNVHYSKDALLFFFLNNIPNIGGVKNYLWESAISF